MPDFSFEMAVLAEGSSSDVFVVGVDEAGCGPWAGPVVAGAVIFPYPQRVPESLLVLLNDSKTLSEKKREMAYASLHAVEGEHCWVGVGQASESEIDRLNIRQAALLAMQRAVDSLPHKPQYALIDGIALPFLSCPAQALKKGDGRSYSIAAASIIAKVTRDRLMGDLAKIYPEYHWEKNAGYGTKAHQEALAQYGVTPHHRRSFAPIAALLQQVA